jgi:hypothetical protein
VPKSAHFGPNLAEFLATIKSSNIQFLRGVTDKMRVAVDVFALAGEPSVQVQYDHVLGMMLRPGFVEVGLQRSAMRRVNFQAGEMGFFPRYMERWVGCGHQERLLLLISDAALLAAREGISHTGDLDHWCKMGDVRLAALVKAVLNELRGFRVDDCFWIPSSRRLLPHWSMPL